MSSPSADKRITPVSSCPGRGHKPQFSVLSSQFNRQLTTDNSFSVLCSSDNRQPTTRSQFN